MNLPMRQRHVPGTRGPFGSSDRSHSQVNECCRLSRGALALQLCTKTDQCTRPTCFFAHAEDQLRTSIPKTMADMLQLKEELYAEAMEDPVYAEELGKLLVIMEVSRTRQVRLARVQEAPCTTAFQSCGA